MPARAKLLYTVKVRPGGDRDYPIMIGTGLSRQLAPRIKDISSNCQVLLITDRHVGDLYLQDTLRGIKARGIETHPEILPAGERYKNMNTYQGLIKRLASLDDARDIVIVALGGGVVGDIAGFAAATYRRGIPLIQVPATLLACVDSSVGGKTGIDLKEGKNLVGSFHQPRTVVIDLELLDSLPPRELRAGMAEVIKYGFIMDSKFAGRIEKNMDALLSLHPEETASTVKRCCELKARVVRADEHDTKGVRAILNFGHTFAHAIEAACGYRSYRHGEAVGVGMACAADLSVRRGLLSSNAATRIEKTIAAAGLPTKINGTDPETLLNFMQHDKKTKGGKLRFILLERIGSAVIESGIPRRDILAVLKSRNNS